MLQPESDQHAKSNKFASFAAQQTQEKLKQDTRFWKLKQVKEKKEVDDASKSPRNRKNKMDDNLTHIQSPAG